MKPNQIYTSSRYEDFVFKSENRIVNEKDANRIAESMRENGWLGAPIEVSETADGKLQIEDGQHRFVAARKSGTPVRFFVAKTRSAYIQAELNNMVTKWKPMQYIEMYARNGIPSYKRLQTLCEQFPHYNLSLIETACGVSNSKQQEAIKEGRIQISEERFIRARNFLTDLDYVAEPLKRYKIHASYYIRALLALLKVDAFEKEKMVEKLNKYGMETLEDVGSVDKAVDYLERTYNRNNKKEPVYFVDAYKRTKRAMMA